MSLLRPLLRNLAPHGLVRAYDVVAPFDLSPVDVLRNAPLEQLSDPERLEHEVLPRLGLTGAYPFIFPPELQPHLGHGLHAMQLPNQLAPYLAELSRLRLRSYLELGVFQGGTFVITVEYLRRFTALERAIAVDIDLMLNVRRYARRARGIEVARVDSASPAFAKLVADRRPDLVLIDGDHGRRAVRRDWESVRDHAQAVAFHDIVDNPSPGVGELWRELRDAPVSGWTATEFVAQYPEVVDRIGGSFLGIGLLVRQDPA